MILSSGDLARPGLSAARRGHTPVITVSGKGSGRVSVAGLVCLRPDTRGHLGLGNLMARDVDQFAAIIKNRLKRIQYRPELIGGFLAQAGLTLEPEPR